MDISKINCAFWIKNDFNLSKKNKKNYYSRLSLEEAELKLSSFVFILSCDIIFWVYISGNIDKNGLQERICCTSAMKQFLSKFWTEVVVSNNWATLLLIDRQKQKNLSNGSKFYEKLREISWLHEQKQRMSFELSQKFKPR